MTAVKKMLKRHFLTIDEPFGPLSSKNRRKLISSNRFKRFIPCKLEIKLEKSDIVSNKNIIGEPEMKITKDMINDFRLDNQHRKTRHRRRY